MEINNYKKKFEALYKELQSELGTKRPLGIRIYGEWEERGMEVIEKINMDIDIKI